MLLPEESVYRSKEKIRRKSQSRFFLIPATSNWKQSGKGLKVNMRLSILDQSPVSEGSSPGEALARSIQLAQLGDELGYHRFWMSEHHAMQTLACTAPEILLARMGAETKRIRLGSGGIMLPHYSAFKIAEQFSTLEALYPNRIDLGVGRAPGGGPLESLALRRERRVQPVDDFADQLSELLAFFEGDFAPQHPFSKLRVMPESAGSPDVWLLGSSMWSASAAAEFGLPYAFAHFFSPQPTRAAIESYRRAFVPDKHRSAAEAMIAIGVIVAPTQDEAEYLHASVRLLQRRIRQGDRRPLASPEDALNEMRGVLLDAGDEGEWPRYVVGTPERVRVDLEMIGEALKLDELIINTITWDHAARLRSYKLLADVMELRVSPEQKKSSAERPKARELITAGSRKGSAA